MKWSSDDNKTSGHQTWFLRQATCVTLYCSLLDKGECTYSLLPNLGCILGMAVQLPLDPRVTLRCRAGFCTGCAISILCQACAHEDAPRTQINVLIGINTVHLTWIQHPCRHITFPIIYRDISLYTMLILFLLNVVRFLYFFRVNKVFKDLTS
jgi:hypothetical protein